MVIDTSAIVAILLSEPEASRFKDLIEADNAPAMSSVSYYELGVLAVTRRGRQGVSEVGALIRLMDISIVPFDQEHANLASDAYDRFGKGRHKARLNFADCASYALAKSMGEPLLFKGGDFALTDIDRVAL